MISFYLHPDAGQAALPTKATDNAGAYDLYMPAATKIPPKQTIKVRLGLSWDTHGSNFAGLIMPRSSTYGKYGITLANTLGLIDQDFAGEWKVQVTNVTDKDVVIEQGSRLFQLLILQVPTTNLVQASAPPNKTARGDQGFGTTGT